MSLSYYSTPRQKMKQIEEFFKRRIQSQASALVRVLELLQCQQEWKTNFEKSIENWYSMMGSSYRSFKFVNLYLDFSGLNFGATQECSFSLETQRILAYTWIHFIKFITLLFSDLLINTVLLFYLPPNSYENRTKLKQIIDIDIDIDISMAFFSN